jgi:hypothetical protein
MTLKSSNGTKRINNKYPILSSLLHTSLNKKLNTKDKNHILLNNNNKNLLKSQKIRLSIIKYHLFNFINHFDDKFDSIDCLEKFCVINDILDLKYLLNKI